MGKKGKGKGKSKSDKTTDLKNDPNICLSSGDFTFPNGDKYSGEYCAHRLGVVWRQGHGIYTTHEGQIYEGEWTDDKLVDNSELVVKYPSGAEFHGRFINSKYNGPGIYTLTNKLDISCEFTNNQPHGEIILVDCNGKLWRGEAQKDSALLIPENIFYLIIPEGRGKGAPRTEEYEIASTSLGGEEEELDYPDEYWRELIFAKSTKTTDDVDFTDSKWSKQHKKFRDRYSEINHKLADQTPLDDDDQDWLSRLQEYKDRRRMKQAEKELAKKKSSEAVFDLNRKFRSTEFLDACPEVKIFRKSKRWDDDETDITVTSSSTSSSDNICQSKFDKSRLRSKVLVKKDVSDHRTSKHSVLEDIIPAATKLATEKLMQEMDELFLNSKDIEPQDNARKQLVQFEFDGTSNRITTDLLPTKDISKKYARSISAVERLHFTKERQQLALQMRVQKILERKQADEDQIFLFSQAKEMVGQMEALKKSEADGVESVTEGSAIPIVAEESKTPDATVKSSSTKNVADTVEDREARILRHINERVEKWQNAEDAKKTKKAQKKITPPPKLHLHSVGIDTESLPDIPKDIFVRMVSGGLRK